MQQKIYPIHLKAIPERGIKKDCYLNIEMKKKARQDLARRIRVDLQEGLNVDEIEMKYAKYAH